MAASEKGTLNHTPTLLVLFLDIICSAKPTVFLSEMKAVGYILYPSATNLLCFAIAMAASEDPAFAAISKQEYFLLLRSVKLAPRSKSRRVIVA